MRAAGPDKTQEPPSLRAPWWVWVAAGVLLLVAQFYFQRASGGSLAYSDFRRVLEAGKVEELVIATDTLSGSLRNEGLEPLLEADVRRGLDCAGKPRCRFTAVRVSDPDLVADLQQAKVRYTGVPEAGWGASLLTWLLPLLFMYWILRGAMRGGMPAAGLFDIGRSHARMYEASKSGVRFADVAGIDEAREELMEVVSFLKDPDRYRRLGGKIPKGILIVGAPGTGKTLLAKAVAGEAGVPFFSISGSEFVEMFVGVGAARVRDLFAQAQAKAPCIIFIDELDALGRARGVGGVVGGYNEQEQTLNQLLVEMDGFDTSRGVIILAATNRPEILDPALLRPGRFDRHIALDRPDVEGREQILRVHARNVRLAPQVDLKQLARRTAGFAGADLANLVNEAALLAGRAGKDQVEMADFDEAIERSVAGLQKRARVMSRTEKEIVAYHEAGHALIAESRPGADRVAKISIIPRGIAALGYTHQMPAEDRHLLQRRELLDRLDVFLGGRLAEELVFGDSSTGAQNDLQMATDLARRMVTQYGMSEGVGLTVCEGGPNPFGLPAAAPQRAFSEHTAQTVDAEVARLLAEAGERVRRTLTERRAALEALARGLLEHESLERAEIDALLGPRAAA
ncbi:MAG TPA: ATP-dependent zinc metalloprotease FtsH [Telluria sp.]|nr:ATP-dependent zinc metalloprotease FtsH [Telluria sp.]